MSILLVGMALQVRDLSAVQKLVLVGLCSHAHDDGAAAWPSRSTLGRYASVTPRTASRALTSLRDDEGLIVEGDQRHVAHIRADRRPVVWNIRVDALSTRAAEPNAATGGQDGPPVDATGGQGTPPRVDAGRHHGWTPASTKESLEPSTPNGEPSTARDDTTDVDGFDELWDTWPRRNGKRLHRARAERQWSKIAGAERPAVLVGARNYRAASDDPTIAAGAMDAFRWLRDELWHEWQEPAIPDRPTTGPRATGRFQKGEQRW